LKRDALAQCQGQQQILYRKNWASTIPAQCEIGKHAGTESILLVATGTEKLLMGGHCQCHCAALIFILHLSFYSFSATYFYSYLYLILFLFYLHFHIFFRKDFDL
jgi:hypothetical protein